MPLHKKTSQQRNRNDNTALCADMEHRFNLTHLDGYLPMGLADVRMRLANAFNLPEAGMLTAVVAIAPIR